MNLVQITYYRTNDVENIKSAVVTENQVDDIKRLLRHIKVINVSPAPKDSVRTYLLK